MNKSNCLTLKAPHLIPEWDVIKNKPIKPTDVTYGSEKYIWWKCFKGHSWQARICNRVRGSGCPYCAHQWASEEYNLKDIYPNILSEWDYEKNSISPEKYLPRSSKKVWWLCKRGHSWEASINKRTVRKHGCPYCSGKRPSASYNLEVLFPKLIKEWDFVKNKIKPNKLTPGSNKKVSWICKNNHQWIASPNSRTSGKACPFCAGQKICKDNNLLATHPNLAKEWNYKKNKIDPSEIITGAGKKMWWICFKGHEWQTTINSRKCGKGCPECANCIAGKDNNLAKTNPELAQQWDFKKNKKLPEEVLSGTIKKYFWICEKGHSWKASVCNRSRGKGCPKCSNNISKKEIKWLDSMNIPDDNKHRNVSIKIDNTHIRADGYIPETNTIYEFYGDYWHGNPDRFDSKSFNPSNKKTFGYLYNKTIQKEKLIKGAGFNLVTIWEHEFDKLVR